MINHSKEDPYYHVYVNGYSTKCSLIVHRNWSIQNLIDYTMSLPSVELLAKGPVKLFHIYNFTIKIYTDWRKH